jgi:hypothetical protein
MKRSALLATLIGIAAVLAPVIVYTYTFGANISNNHARWAEFGSAIGGIYSPILAMLTLAVLVWQVALQRQMNIYEYDQAYLQQARSDIEFYSNQLVNIIGSTVLPGKTLRDLLHENFQPTDAAELDSIKLKELSASTHHLIPASFDVWAAVYPTLMGLEAGKTRMYNLTLSASQQKLIALLSFETCVTLDNFHRARSEGRSKVEYMFSPILAKDEK